MFFLLLFISHVNLFVLPTLSRTTLSIQGIHLFFSSFSPGREERAASGMQETRVRATSSLLSPLSPLPSLLFSLSPTSLTLY